MRWVKYKAIDNYTVANIENLDFFKYFRNYKRLNGYFKRPSLIFYVEYETYNKIIDIVKHSIINQ